MGEEKALSENRKSAISYREKTHFFILSLIFTTLAFSIQTAKFRGPIESQLCELIAWLYLSISGFSELFILMTYPKHLNLVAQKQDIEKINSIKGRPESTIIELNETNLFIK